MPKSKITAIITARGGSKRIPGKNIKLLNGKPLLWYPIRDAHKSRYIDNFFVSTDDSNIAAVAQRYGAEVIIRPKELATDRATSDSVLKHAIKYLHHHGLVVLLQPTAPLRTVQDVDRCIKLFLHHRPSILVTMGPRGSYTGSIYIFRAKDYARAQFRWQSLLHQNPYIHMMSARHEATNINHLKDWKAAEKLLFMKDADFELHSFNKHLAKEQRFSDAIGRLYPYLYGQGRLSDLKKKDDDLYRKLRDNPERIKALTGMPCGPSIIDIGCSEGLITMAIAEKNKTSSVVGIDIRPKAIKRSLLLWKRWPAHVRERVKFSVALPGHLLKARGKFDTVFFTEVLEHIAYTDHARILTEITRLLNHNGNLVISVPNRYPAKRYEQDGRQRWEAPAHLSYFGRSNFEALLKRYFKKVDFYTLRQDRKPEDGIWLIANCYGTRS